MKTFGLVVFLWMLLSRAWADLTYGDFTYTAGYVNSVAVATITGYTGAGGDVTFPDSINGWPVIAIKSFAFEHQATITNVFITTNVTSIGAFAFAHCSALGNVSLSQNVTNIGPAAFADCPGITAFNLAEGNPAYRSINGVLFNKSNTQIVEYPCGGLANYSVPQGVVTIGESAFNSCTNLVSVTLPASLGNIATHSFDGCSSLLALQVPYGITNIESWAFNGCISLTNLSLPDSISVLGAYLLYGCSLLASIHIPTNVASLASVFTYSGLQTAIVPEGVTNLASAFAHSANLKSVVLPQSLTDIGFQAFYSCSSLTNVVFGTNVTSIGQDVFSDCMSLARITLPESLTNMVEDTFGGCLSLTNIVIPPLVTSMGYGVFYFCTNLTGVYFEGNAPTNLGTSIFAYDTLATVYYLPDTTGWSNTFAGRPTAPWLPSIQLSGGVGFPLTPFGFNVFWAADHTIIIESSTNLANWVPISTNVLTMDPLPFADQDWTNHLARFYRLCAP